MTDRSCGEEIPFLLAQLGVDTVFGMPGVHSLELYRSLEAAGITHVSVRHEQGAGFMADGYARAGRRPGVALVISGPGVTNASTPLGQAYSDSVPLLLLSSAIARSDLGMNHGALHEIPDQRGLTTTITGLSAMAYTAAQVPHHLIAAHAKFRAARPRPVHLSVPLDVLAEPATSSTIPPPPSPPGPDPAKVCLLAEMLAQAGAPLILAGGGAVAAAQDIQALVETTASLFVSTIAGKGILSDSHPQSLGSSMQRLATRRAIAEADLVLAIGTEIAEPDLYVTADAEASGDVPAEMLEPRLLINGRFARIDIDPDVILRDYAPELSLVSDAALAVKALREVMGAQAVRSEQACMRAKTITQENLSALSPLEAVHHRVLLALRAALPADGLVYADMTQIAYTGSITFPTEQPGCWHFPMGYGTLGYALPAAIGGQLACPNRAVAALVGDGGLQFTLQEIATAVELKLPIPILLWDNGALGEIADFMQARQIPKIGVHPGNPDFSVLAQAYNTGYAAPDTPERVTDAVQAALTAKGPTLIHLRQDSFGG